MLQVAGPVTHPWLDQFKQVNGCEKVPNIMIVMDCLILSLQLMNWTKSSSLVEVVEESMSAVSSLVDM